MKRLLILLLALLLTGCTATERETEDPSALPTQNAAQIPDTPEAVKTGLAVVGSISKSMNATPDFPGVARTEVTFVALTVDDEGVIRSCCIDGVSAIIPFDATGALQTEDEVDFASKNELGDEYAMHKASAIGAEWRQQAAAFADYAVGKRVGELSAGDVTTSVTISTDAILQAITSAVETATHQGAQVGDRLTLAALSHSDESHSASLDENTDGYAAFRTDAAAVTWRDGAITSCRFDALQTQLPITPEGIITAELSAPQLSLTSISRSSPLSEFFYPAQDWCRQAKTFAQTALGKTADDVRGSAVSASTGSSSAVFHALLYKSAQDLP